MSEYISIAEGGKSRNFGPVNLLETETADGEGSCFWVPESDRELETEFIMSNGDYLPEKYAFSELDVHVMEPIGDFEITIDDIDLPHIDIEDPDIDITIDPNTGLPELTIDGVEVELPDISADIDINGDIDISLDVDDLGDIDLDISGIDLDGLDVNLDIDLDTLDIDVTDLPDEIRIMHVPNKTAYKDGEEIDLDGLVVQAYRGGEVWNDTSGKYIDGYVPAHKLQIDPQIAKYTGTHDMPIFTTPADDTSIEYRANRNTFSFVQVPIGTVFNGNIKGREYTLTFGGKVFATMFRDTWAYGDYENIVISSYEEFTFEYYGPDYPGQPKQNWSRSTLRRSPNAGLASLIIQATVGKNGFIGAQGNWYEYNFGYVEADMAYFGNGRKHESVTAVNVSWPRSKDNKLLTASFDITVEESEGGTDHGGSHHSGKF